MYVKLQVLNNRMKELFPNTEFWPIKIHDEVQMVNSKLKLQWPKYKGWKVISDREPCEVLIAALLFHQLVIFTVQILMYLYRFQRKPLIFLHHLF